ncbi:hypothetical protein V6N13_039486 [Hibiscus sabdariffa]
MALRLDLNKPLVSKLLINGQMQVVEYESLPTICFTCGKYGHVSEFCPGSSSAHEHFNPHSESATKKNDSTKEAFGPWMLVEKRQRRPTRKPSASNFQQHVGPSIGSRFDPISDALADTIESETVVEPVPATGLVSHDTAQNHKGKSTAAVKKQRAIPIRKPLAVTLNDFPIAVKSATKASSSHTVRMRDHSSTLDKARHSSIVISENSDPNLQLFVIVHSDTSGYSNPAILGKPPDHRKVPNAELSPTDLCQVKTNTVASVDPRVAAHESAMLE